MPTIFRRVLPALLLSAAAVVCLGGCTQRYAGDVTPELDSYAHNSTQDHYRYARVIDHNTRGIWDDLANFLLINEPSQLHRYPVP